MLKEQHFEKGRQLAVRYLKEEEADLEAELARLQAEAQTAAKEAAKGVLLRNITLPRTGELDPRQTRALEGLATVASNKKGMALLIKEVEQIWQQFLMARNNAFQQLKASFSQQLNTYARALEAQLGQRVRLEVEHLPQFQEEWRKFETNLTTQFEPVLEDRKIRMMSL